MFIQDQGRIDIYDCVFRAVADAGTNAGQYADAIVNDDGGTINMYNTYLSASGGSLNNYGSIQNGSGIINFYSGAISTSGTGAYDTRSDPSGVMGMTASVKYDMSKTSGTVTYLDKNQIYKSISSGHWDGNVLNLTDVGVFQTKAYGGDAPMIVAGNLADEIGLETYNGLQVATYDTNGQIFYYGDTYLGIDTNNLQTTLLTDLALYTNSPRGPVDFYKQTNVPTPAATTGVTFTYNGAATGNYYADGNDYGFKVYAYMNGAWSGTPLSMTGTDNGSSDPMIITANWAAVTGATKYRVQISDPYYTGATDYSLYYEVTGTTFSLGDSNDYEDQMSYDVNPLEPTSYGPNFYLGINQGTYMKYAHADSFYGDGTNVTGVFHPGGVEDLDMGFRNIKNVFRIGVSANFTPSYPVDVRTGYATTLLHFSSAASTSDNGGYLMSAGPGNFFMSAGASWSGHWVARNGSASIIGGGPSNDGVLTFYTNSGLTAGKAFSPTERMRLDDAGRFGIGLNPGSGGYLTIKAGTTTIPPILLTSGTNNTTAKTGAIEYNGTNLFFTRTGTTRENVWVGNDGASAPSTNTIGTIADYYGSSSTRVLTTPNSWGSVVIGGTTYKIPLFT